MDATQHSLDHAFIAENFLNPGLGNLLEEIFEVYLDQSGRSLSEIQEAFEKGDMLQVSQAAHNLKGASGSVGASAMADLLQQLEDTAQSAPKTVVLELIKETASEAAKTEAAIEAELKKMKNADELDLF